MTTGTLQVFKLRSLLDCGMKKKVVFFFPSFASSEATAPLGILAVATPLLRAGYEVCLIDSTITPNYKKRVLEEVRDAICLGVSLVTGPMIRETVEIARAIKESRADFPIILGGWHPSLLPAQTLEAPFVDYVIRGQGEEALLELVQHIESKSAPDFVEGIGFKRAGKLIFSNERALRPLVDMPPKAYQLADFDAYERLCGRRWAMYTSSLACPFNCAYCTNGGVYGRKWNALPARQFAEETVDLTRRYNLEMLWVVDDNFLVDLDRARDIAEDLIRAERGQPGRSPAALASADAAPARSPLEMRMTSRSTRRPLVLAAVMASNFMIAIEATIVSTAMPQIVGQLGGLQLYSWVFSAFLLTQTATTVVFGKLVRPLGRKTVMLSGIAIFLVGSILCGFAWSMPSLIVFRLVQGVGAGAVQPTAHDHRRRSLLGA